MIRYTRPGRPQPEQEAIGWVVLWAVCQVLPAILFSLLVLWSATGVYK